MHAQVWTAHVRSGLSEFAVIQGSRPHDCAPQPVQMCECHDAEKNNILLDPGHIPHFNHANSNFGARRTPTSCVTAGPLKHGQRCPASRRTGYCRAAEVWPLMCGRHCPASLQADGVLQGRRGVNGAARLAGEPGPVDVLVLVLARLCSRAVVPRQFRKTNQPCVIAGNQDHGQSAYSCSTSDLRSRDLEI